VSEVAARLMPEPEAATLLSTYGVDYVVHEVAATADEAAAAAARIGFPVVLKVISADIVHKSDAGGVVLGLADGAAVRRGHAAMLEAVSARAPGARIDGMLVSRQVSGAGAELIVGAVRDATFGPTVMLGAGGVFAEVLQDVSFRLAPLSHDEALDMLQELRAFATLTGYRDVPPLDVGALAEVAVRLGDLMIEHQEVAEIDLNPVLAFPRGCVAVDARILTSAPAGDLP
jgi:acyl-CoA synthetase (NDP forming)